MSAFDGFPDRCREAIEALLDEAAIETRFERLGEGAAIFQRAVWAHAGKTLEIYIYPRGAGLKIERGWFVYEDHQYPRPGALIDAFSSELRERIASLRRDDPQLLAIGPPAGPGAAGA